MADENEEHPRRSVSLALMAFAAVGWLAAGFTPKGLLHWTADTFNNPARPDVKCFPAPARMIARLGCAGDDSV